MPSFNASGANVVIRVREWIVCWADASDDDGFIVAMDGLPELVNGKSAFFLNWLKEAENAIRVPSPASDTLNQNRQIILVASSLGQVKPPRADILAAEPIICHIQFARTLKYEAKTYNVPTDRIAFILSEGLVGVGLGCKANKKELNEGSAYCFDALQKKRRRHSPRLGRHPAFARGSVYKTLERDLPPSLHPGGGERAQREIQRFVFSVSIGNKIIGRPEMCLRNNKLGDENTQHKSMARRMEYVRPS